MELQTRVIKRTERYCSGLNECGVVLDVLDQHGLSMGSLVLKRPIAEMSMFSIGRNIPIVLVEGPTTPQNRSSK